MAEPRLLLLDEPSMGPCAAPRGRDLRLRAALLARDTAVLLVEQNARAALAIADRAYVLETAASCSPEPGRRSPPTAGVRAAYLGL
jgi:branched-chain amino acid transport system ATP-binding protein